MDLKFFRFGGESVVFDVQRAALFELDEAAERALHAPPGTPVEPRVAAEIGRLRAWGYLQPASEPPPDPAPPVDIRPQIDSITLGLTHHCNLRCNYCFGSGYLHAQQEDDAEIFETGRACLDLLAENQNRATTRHRRCSLVFFGGEPLLKFDLIRRLVRYGRRRFSPEPGRLTFGITTNGTLLDAEKAVFLRDHGITPLVSVDGSATAHDAYRRTAHGAGSFAGIRRRLLEARALGLPFGARVSVTQHNVDLVAVMDELDELGFFSYKFVPLSGRDRFALTPANRRRLFRSCREMADLFIHRLRRDEPIRFDLFDTYLEDLFSARGRPWCCDAGMGSVSVGPGGEVFSCYKLAGEPEAQMGSVHDGEILAHRPHLDHAGRVETLTACRRCWVRRLCSGACFADRHLAAKTQEHQCFQTHCQLTRLLVAEAVRIIHHCMGEDRHLLARYLGRKEKSTHGNGAQPHTSDQCPAPRRARGSRVLRGRQL